MKPVDDANHSGGGSGMSRAAKKRAKKNQKKGHPTTTTTAVESKRPADDDGPLALADKKKKKKPKLEDAVVAANEGKTGSLRKNFPLEEEDEDPNDNDSEDKGDVEPTTTVMLDSSDSYIPSLPNASLTEILMMNPTDDDETKRKLIESLPASQRATCLFQAILDPIPLDQFYSEYWERKPLLVKAKGNKKRYANLLSLESIRKMTKDHPQYFAQDLNVTRYQKDKEGVKRRITLDKLPNRTGTGDAEDVKPIRVDPSELWSNYDKGCTVRLLCPHKHSDAIHALLSTLELELQCMVGANAYLTPPKASQGFAPHYDDIEAFCLQLEGSKRWKVYPPNLELPRVSSEDFTPEDLEGKTPVMDVTLEEGDLLYMPRGWIHQACTLRDDNEHSLHLTISAMQQWAWVDLLDMIMPEALENAATSDTSTSLREGLPRGFLDYMGAMYEEPSDEKLPESMRKVAEEDTEENEERKLRKMLQDKFRADAKKRIMKVAKAACEMVDVGCDQLAKRFMSDRQPFALTKAERELTCNDEGKAEDQEILPNTLCRLVRPGVARLVIEDEKAVLYHCGDNSREYRGNPLSPMEFEMDDGPAIEQLLTTVEPHWIFVNDLYHDTIEDKVAIAQTLYDEGILAIKNQVEEIAS